MKIKSIGLSIALLLALMTIAAFSASIAGLGKVEAIGDSWTKFEREAARKEAFLSEMNNAIGYGGLIHEFKNYILRQDRARTVKIRAKASRATAAADGYAAIASDPVELQALEIVRATVAAYLTALSAAELLVEDGNSPLDIDRRVAIDDRMALDALVFLRSRIRATRDRQARAVDDATHSAEAFVKQARLPITFALLSLVGLVFWFSRFRLSAALSGIEDTMTRLAAGDTTVAVPALGRADEIGDMAKAVQVFKEDAIEKVRLEKSSERSTRLFAKAFRAGSGLMTLIRLSDGKLLDVNEAWCKSLGYSREETLGKTTRELGLFADPGDRDALYREIERSGCVRAFESRLRTKDGRDVFVRMYGDRLEIDGEAVVLAVNYDESERKRVEGALNESEDRFRTIAETTPIAITISRVSDGKLVYVNRKVEEIFGRLPDGVRGHKTAEFYQNPEDRKVLMTRLRAQGSIQDYEIGLRGVAGKPISALISMECITYGGEEAVLSTITDISVRKNYEAALRAAKEEAEIANRSKTEFLANMSHELRTPLNAILGFSEVLQTGLLGDMQGKHQEYVKDIHSCGVHLLALINDVLDLSKIELGEMHIEEVEVDLGDALERCTRLMSERLLRGRLELRKEPIPKPVAIRGDARKVKQIVLNLLSNAVKFTEPGGTITVGGGENEAGGAFLTVSDTGIGMTPDEVKKALAVFGQVESGMSRNYDGTGLGLPLSKSLMEEHGGTLEVVSEPGVGTTVTVSFPAERLLDGGLVFPAATFAAMERS